jgi:hypothetical protein
MCKTLVAIAWAAAACVAVPTASLADVCGAAATEAGLERIGSLADVEPLKDEAIKYKNWRGSDQLRVFEALRFARAELRDLLEISNAAGILDAVDRLNKGAQAALTVVRIETLDQVLAKGVASTGRVTLTKARFQEAVALAKTVAAPGELDALSTAEPSAAAIAALRAFLAGKAQAAETQLGMTIDSYTQLVDLLEAHPSPLAKKALVHAGFGRVAKEYPALADGVKPLTTSEMWALYDRLPGARRARWRMLRSEEVWAFYTGLAYRVFGAPTTATKKALAFWIPSKPGFELLGRLLHNSLAWREFFPKLDEIGFGASGKLTPEAKFDFILKQATSEGKNFLIAFFRRSDLVQAHRDVFEILERKAAESKLFEKTRRDWEAARAKAEFYGPLPYSVRTYSRQQKIAWILTTALTVSPAVYSWMYDAVARYLHASGLQLTGAEGEALGPLDMPTPEQVYAVADDLAAAAAALERDPDTAAELRAAWRPVPAVSRDDLALMARMLNEL